MPVRKIEDIEKEKNERVREEFKTKVVDDFEDVKTQLLENIKKKVEEKKKKETIFSKIVIFLWRLGVFMLILNFVLGNIWLIKFFAKQLLGL